MGAPIPAGWVQPAPWPVRRYPALRKAVLFLYANRCQRCGANEGVACAMIDSTDGLHLTNLVAVCFRCIGKRTTWTAAETDHLRVTAAANRTLLTNMTGWGLNLQRAAPEQPKRVRHGKPGRPNKRTPDNRRTVDVHFMITPAQARQIHESRPGVNLNAFARDRMLSRRHRDVVAKQLLNDVAVQLLRIIEATETAIGPYNKAAPDHHIVALIARNIADLKATHGTVIEAFFKV